VAETRIDRRRLGGAFGVRIGRDPMVSGFSAELKSL
jgi:hypothetical protein